MMTLDGAARCRHPEQHVCAGVVAALAGECRGDVDRGLGPRIEIGQMRCNALKVRPRLTHAGQKRCERVVELMPGHCQRASPVPQLVCRLAGEIERVGDACQPLHGRERHDGPFPAGVSQCNQMASQVPAIDRGDIGRIEWAKIARVVPVVEMSAKPAKLGHGGQRHLQPFSRFRRAQPSEIARGRHREEIEPEIGWRRPVGQYRGRVLLEVVRRQHIVGCRHEGLEEPPGSPSGHPQCLTVRN
ncbi:MAG TPA: hypothetical protein VMB34_30325 [Acetobacteraceae bacterium]|nr:hypothetical protein [Acetobacteraceae bacterium]